MSKVAEEAVSGWEKADAEASALKHQLESVTLLKLTAQDQASHLGGALKECMRQIRTVREENEKKLHEVVLTKTKQCDKIKLDLEAKIVDLDQRLLRSAAENAALSRSLQEHYSKLMKINEEKSHAAIENELLKEKVQSYEKEINSLKYELHVLTKELDIRNEEKNMSLKSAEAANKQNLESAKRIAKLEAECQRLCGLVRKKLPGPAAMAQMKQEVVSWGHNLGDSRSVLQRSLGKNSKPTSLPEFSTDYMRPDHKETEIITKRFLAMEEMKMLKEALATRNSDLQSSRDTCSKMSGKIKDLEVQLQILKQQRSSPRSIIEVCTEGSSQNASNLQSVSSSEDGLDGYGVFSRSWVMTSVSDLSSIEEYKHIDKGIHLSNANSLDLMDDFLEMERMAHSANNSDKVSISWSSNCITNKNDNCDASIDIVKNDKLLQSESQSARNPSYDQVPDVKGGSKVIEINVDQFLLPELLSRISIFLETKTMDTDMSKLLEDAKFSIQEIKESLACCSFRYFKKGHPDNVPNNLQTCPHEGTINNKILLTKCSKLCIGTQDSSNKNLVLAVYHIHQCVISVQLCNESS